MSEIINEKPSGAVAASAVEVPSSRQRQTIGQLLRGDLGFLPVLLTLIVIVIIFSFTTGGIFLQPRNLSNLMNQVSYIGILALGSTMALLLGEIDLSVAVVGSLCAVVMAVLSERMGYPGGLAILIGILAGALVGFVNGIFVAILRVPSFIVTLAGSIGYSGLLLFLLAGQSTLIISNPLIDSIAGTSTSFLTDAQGISLPTIALLIYIASLIFVYINRRRNGLREGSLAALIGRIVVATVLVEGGVILFESYNGVPYTAAIVFGLIAIFWILLTKTSFGRHVYAVGGNAEAARRAGINVTYIRIMAFTLCSALSAVGGIVLASRSLSVQSQIPATLLLDAIAAAVIGGVSLFGGRGSVWSIVLGMLIIGSLENGLDLKSQPVEVKEMIEGAVLLLAVTVDAVLRRVQSRSASGR